MVLNVEAPAEINSYFVYFWISLETNETDNDKLKSCLDLDLKHFGALFEDRVEVISKILFRGHLVDG